MSLSSERALRLAYLGDANSIHFRRWISWFARRGHEVHVLAADPAATEPGLPASIAIHAFEPYTHARLRPIGAWRSSRSLRRVLAATRPDMLHGHYLTVHGWHAWLSGFHPYGVTVWGSDILLTARASTQTRFYARRALGAADLVTGDSTALVKAAIASGAAANRTHLVQFGVDSGRFSPEPANAELRHRLGLDGWRVIFSPRSIAPLYRQRVVLDALAQLPANVAVVMTLHLARPDELASLERHAAELGLTDRVRLLPTVEYGEMADMYRLADVVVSIPASDGTPVTLLEALASGRPTVATDIPSVREWLGDLDPSSLVPVDDATATAAAIRRVLDRDQAEIARRAEQGRDLVLARADQDRSMARVEQLYFDVVRHASATGAADRADPG